MQEQKAKLRRAQKKPIGGIQPRAMSDFAVRDDEHDESKLPSTIPQHLNKAIFKADEPVEYEIHEESSESNAPDPSSEGTSAARLANRGIHELDDAELRQRLLWRK